MNIQSSTHWFSASAPREAACPRVPVAALSKCGDNIIIGFPQQRGRAAAAAMRREPGPQSHTSYAEPCTLLHTPAHSCRGSFNSEDVHIGRY